MLLRILSQNVNRSSVVTHTLLETKAEEYDVLLIQEPYWGFLRNVPSAVSCTGEEYQGTQAHPHWILVERGGPTRVTTYINKRLAPLQPKLCTHIVDHPDLLLVSIPEGPRSIYILNVYNDAECSALHYLSEQMPTLPAIDAMLGDFNLHSEIWDPMFHRNDRAVTELLDLTDGLGLILLNTDGQPTHIPHARETTRTSTVIDLTFVSGRIAVHPATTFSIDPEGRLLSDHNPLLLTFDSNIDPPPSPPRIKRKSDAEQMFFAACVSSISSLHPPPPLDSIQQTQELCDSIFARIAEAFRIHATSPSISRYSKTWWTDKCSESLARYRATRSFEDRRAYRRTIHEAQRQHYDSIIQDTVEKQRVWDLMAWTRPRPLPLYHNLVHNGAPLTSMSDLFRGLHDQFYSAAGRPVDLTLADSLPDRPERECPPISLHECREAAASCSSSSAPGPDHVTWPLVQLLISTPESGAVLLALYNACLHLGYWPNQFKESITVVIPKPKKTDYSKLKSYRPIVLLSCIGKLMEKVLANRLQFEGAKYNILHPNQFGGTRFHCTEDAGVMLTQHIRAGWREGLHTSCVALDVAQFFPSINHDMLIALMRKQGFSSTYLRFFESFLPNRRTTLSWNGTSSDPFVVNVGAGQGSALSPIISGLYLAAVLHTLDPVGQRSDWDSLLFYVDDGLLVTSSVSLAHNCEVLADKYRLIANSLARLGLVIEHDKTGLIHFPRKGSKHCLPSISLAGRVIEPLPTWRYLGFFFDQQLSFKEHVRFYATRALSTVKCALRLGNSIRGLSPIQRRTLYKSCVIPLLTYGCRVWWRKHGIKGLMTILSKAQHEGVRWILSAFRTSPIGGMEVLSGVPPLHLHIRKLVQRAALRTLRLPSQHPINAALYPQRPHEHSPHIPFPLKRSRASSTLPIRLIRDMIPQNCETFAPLHPEACPGNRVLDMFADRINMRLSHPARSSPDFPTWIQDLKLRIEREASSPHTTLCFSDGSYSPHNGKRAGCASLIIPPKPLPPIVRKLACGQATAFDAEIMGLTIALHHATLIEDSSDIILYADNEAALKALLNPSVHPSQMCSILACQRLRAWLSASPNRHITIAWCPGHVGVPRQEQVDTLAKSSLRDNPPAFASASFLKQKAYTSMLEAWQSLMKSTKYSGHDFPRQRYLRKVASTHSRVLTQAGGQNSLAARIARLLLNHGPTGEYRKKFFPFENTTCNWCREVQSRTHILFWCTHYQRPPDFTVAKYLTNRNPLPGLIQFLRDNPSAFTFEDAPLNAEDLFSLDPL